MIIVLLQNCGVYFVFFIFIVYTDHINIFTTKISRSIVVNVDAVIVVNRLGIKLILSLLATQLLECVAHNLCLQRKKESKKETDQNIGLLPGKPCIEYMYYYS